MNVFKKCLSLLALASLAHAQCDPPGEVTQTDCGADGMTEETTVCPSAEEAPDESITFADCGHCQQYYECYNGCLTGPWLCEDGLLYDPLLGCNFAEDVSCGNRDCDDEPCNTAPTDAPADFDCPEPDGTYPDPDNCIKYFLCSGDVAVEKICPVENDLQELWCAECNGGEGYCDFPENVECGDRPICDENDENCEMQPTSPPSLCDGIPCPAEGIENVELGPCEECYCECVDGVIYDLCCSEGLYYNPNTGTCDWDYNNPGCDSRIQWV